jgi:hypothetical protein
MIGKEAAMFSRTDVRFPAEGGIDLSAWLFVPKAPGRRACARSASSAPGYALAPPI